MSLSFIPFVMFAVSILSVFGKMNIIQLPEGLLEYTGSNEIVKFVSSTVRSSSSSTSVITAVISLWTAGRGMYIITDGINRIYRLPKKSFWLVKRIYAMGYTTVMLLIMIIIFALLSVGTLFNEEMNALLNDILPSWMGNFMLSILADILLIFFMTLALKLYLLSKVPDRRYVKFRVLLPGTVITVIAWNLYIFGMQIYTAHFSTSSVYGSLGTVAVFMMIVYFMMYILLCGIQLNFIYKDAFLNFKIHNIFRSKKQRRS